MMQTQGSWGSRFDTSAEIATGSAGCERTSRFRPDMEAQCVSRKNLECFQPEEIELLQRIFDRICSEGRVARGTLFEEQLAAWLIALYQGGERDEAKLIEASRTRIANFTSQPTSIATPLAFPTFPKSSQENYSKSAIFWPSDQRGLS
ncbi:hypothetical protein MesoLj113c_40330 [Mesorhizobium sp. 113-3-9]|nr:hypothetical protein MesoLj113c_40330 [Mesorhizobium sp. 113-3-9]